MIITKDAIIHGDLICFSGNIEMDGKIIGKIKVYGGHLFEEPGKLDIVARLSADWFAKWL